MEGFGMDKSKTVKFRISEDDYNLILLKARTERKTFSEYIRETALNKRVPLPVLKLQEGARVSYKAYDSNKAGTGIVKKDFSGRLYILDIDTESRFYPCKWDEIATLED